MKRLLAVILFFSASAYAITPPAVTQPKPGILVFTWSAPTTREGGLPLAASEIGGYELYLSNESAVIKIAGTATQYTYIVPLGYTTSATDTAIMRAVDTAGVPSQNSNGVTLPAGVSSPKPRIGAPGGLTVVRAPN